MNEKSTETAKTETGECEACENELGDVRVDRAKYERFEDALLVHHALLASQAAELERVRVAFDQMVHLLECGHQDCLHDDDDNRKCQRAQIAGAKARAALRSAKGGKP